MDRSDRLGELGEHLVVGATDELFVPEVVVRDEAPAHDEVAHLAVEHRDGGGGVLDEQAQTVLAHDTVGEAWAGAASGARGEGLPEGVRQLLEQRHDGGVQREARPCHHHRAAPERQSDRLADAAAPTLAHRAREQVGTDRRLAADHALGLVHQADLREPEPVREVLGDDRQDGALARPLRQGAQQPP
ncbi:MAG: hypothetical protein JNL79_20055 [Myxococcales bacterium]|nr:hypothetical protein [Myxococcales bacterium]